MSRIKKNESNAAILEPPAESVANLPQTLEDGHPNPDAMDVWEFMRRLTIDQWDHYIGYLYRIAPKKAATDKPKYLMVFTGPITLEDIQQKFGGKKFTLHLNRKIGSRQAAVYPPVQFDIEAEPIWQDGETPLEPAAARQAAAAAAEGGSQAMALIEKMLVDMMHQRDAAAQAGREYNPTESFKAVLEMNKTAATETIAMVREQAKGEGAGMVGMLTGLIEKLLEKKESPLESKLLDRLLDRAFGDGEKEDPFEKMTSMLDFADRIRGNNPSGGGRSSGTNWGDIAGKFIDQLPGLLQGAKDLLQSAAAARGIQVPGAPGAPGRPALLAAPTPGAAVPGVAPAPPVAPPGGAAPMTEDQASMIVVTRVKQMLIEKLAESNTAEEAKDNGAAAAEYADAMHPAFAEHLARILKTDYAQLAGDPVLSRAAGHPHVLPFCQEYIAFFDEPPADPPAPVPTTKVQ